MEGRPFNLGDQIIAMPHRRLSHAAPACAKDLRR